MQAQKFLVKTLGCKANLTDSQQMETELIQKGWIPARQGEQADLCIVNSCTVTDEADRQSRRLASRLLKEHPQSKVVFTGCAAEVSPEKISASSGIHYVVGNQNKPQLVELILNQLEKTSEVPPKGRPGHDNTEQGLILGNVRDYSQLLSQHPMDREWPAADAVFSTPEKLHQENQGTTRSFFKIQEGCNSFCTYCIIPYGRGPSRSISGSEILKRLELLSQSGVREVVFTGTNLGDYGSDWSEQAPGVEFARLLDTVTLRFPNLRFRLSSLDPTEITDSLLKLMEERVNLCPHFHISLQALHPRILRAMKRKYQTAEAIRCIQKISELKSPEGLTPFVGMDLITGFPGETQEEFDFCLNELQRLSWSRLHVFPYSEREGTPATRMKDSVPISIRKERSRLLNQLSLDRMKSHYDAQLRRREISVLCEKPLRRAPNSVAEKGLGSSRVYAGYSQDYLRVLWQQDAEDPRGSSVRVTDLEVRVDPAGQEVYLWGSSLES